VGSTRRYGLPKGTITVTLDNRPLLCQNSPMMTDSRNTIAWRCTLAACVMLACFFAFYANSSRSFWCDEAYTVYASSKTIPGLIELQKTDSISPMYYLITGPWIKLFGDSEAAVRAHSGLFYLLCLVAIYWLANSLYQNRQAALTCAFIFMVSPVAINQAQNARAYSLLALLTIVSTAAFIKLFHQGKSSRAWFAIYVAANAVAFGVHYWYAFVFLGHGFCILLNFKKPIVWKFFWAMVLSFLPITVLWFPIGFSQFGTGAVTWMPAPTLWDLVKTFLYYFFSIGKGTLLWLAVFAMILIEMKHRRPRLRTLGEIKHAGDGTIALFVILTLSLTLAPIIVSQFRPLYILNRQTLLAFFPLVMILGPLLSRLARPAMLLFFCLLLLGFSFVEFHKNHSTKGLFTDRDTAQYLTDNAGGSDVIIYTCVSRVGIDYYLDKFSPDAKWERFTFPAEIDNHPGWRNIPRMLADSEGLEAEAKSIADRIALEIGNSQRRIWFFYGRDNEVNDYLKRHLDKHFKVINEVKIKGYFHKQILVYGSAFSV
jgi:uncharacterized membrane protein